MLHPRIGPLGLFLFRPGLGIRPDLPWAVAGIQIDHPWPAKFAPAFGNGRTRQVPRLKMAGCEKPMYDWTSMDGDFLFIGRLQELGARRDDECPVTSRTALAQPVDPVFSM